jgi:hypothetical protein
MNHFIEIRSLNLKPNTRDQFHQIFVTQSYPALKQWGFDVVAHGPSKHDENTYYVIRRFDSLSHRQELEDAFYHSDDWKKGPREALLALIEYFTDTVLELDDVTVAGLRGMNQS